MIFETTATAASNPFVRRSQLIRAALEWAAGEGATSEPGTYRLWGDAMYAMVQRRETKPRGSGGLPECHRRYVDLQYSVGGGEIIDWYSREDLTVAKDYDDGNDYSLFTRPARPPVSLILRPGSFAVFFPNDVHVPALTDGENAVSGMIVFKIRVDAIDAP